MSEMVDRVAEAISLSFHEEGYIDGVSDPSIWREFQSAAREAIAAMRMPTQEMLDRGWEVRSVPRYTWENMIDAALK
jgi:hypothetical protein